MDYFVSGTCVNGGRVFREDEHFTCDDGCNGCTCHSTTLMMCYMQEPPELCKGLWGTKTEHFVKITRRMNISLLILLS